MDDATRGDNRIGNKAEDRRLATDSEKIVIQAGQVMIEAAEQAVSEKRDPAKMLRVLSFLAAPVYDPRSPERAPVQLDLRQEWHVLADGIRRSGAPILLAKLTPPTLPALRSALSPRAGEQSIFPHVLHFSGHAWSGGLVLEDDLGQVHSAGTAEILKALEGLPKKLDLVVLNGCESAEDAGSVAQALVEGGLARAAIGHERPVRDDEAVAFAARLYVELTGGFPLGDAVERAKKEITTHEVILLGERELKFGHLIAGEPLVDEGRQCCSLPAHGSTFLGRGPELVQIGKALAHPPAVVVLSGPPGIGKSSLVTEAANRNSWRFSGGVACAAGPRPEEDRKATASEILTALAGDLGLANAEDLLQYSAIQPTLFFLDNMESLEGAETDRLKDFLRGLGNESAAIIAMRPSCEAIEELPSARPIALHDGLAVADAARYALTLASQRNIPLSSEKAHLIASAVDGHPLLVEQLVAQARRRDLDELLEEVEKKKGDFSARIEKVYSWSAARLDASGQAAWKALPLFPAGSTPESVLRAAAGEQGPQKLRAVALADFDQSAQLWRWHATVAEYARGHWPRTQEEQRAMRAALLPDWSQWLKKLPAGEKRTYIRLETSRHNLMVMTEDCTRASKEEASDFLEELNARLPSPERTLAQREMIAAVWKAKLNLLPANNNAERGRLLSYLGVAHSALGRWEKALAVTKDAADIHRTLAEQNPKAFLPDLAGSLNNLGLRYSDMWQREEALVAAKEAEVICRKLAEEDPKAFLPGLAMILNNLGMMHSDIEQLEEALAATNEATEIYRTLAEDNPHVFMPNRAMSLNNLANMLSELGKREEALIAAKKATEICRTLAKDNPEAFMPNLAISLATYGIVLQTFDRHADATRSFAEGLQHLAPFYRKLPQAFSSLANTLKQLYIEACQKAGQEPDGDLLSRFE